MTWAESTAAIPLVATPSASLFGDVEAGLKGLRPFVRNVHVLPNQSIDGCVSCWCVTVVYAASADSSTEWMGDAIYDEPLRRFWPLGTLLRPVGKPPIRACDRSSPRQNVQWAFSKAGAWALQAVTTFRNGEADFGNRYINAGRYVLYDCTCLPPLRIGSVVGAFPSNMENPVEDRASLSIDPESLLPRILLSQSGQQTGDSDGKGGEAGFDYKYEALYQMRGCRLCKMSGYGSDQEP